MFGKDDKKKPDPADKDEDKSKKPPFGKKDDKPANKDDADTNEKTDGNDKGKPPFAKKSDDGKSDDKSDKGGKPPFGKDGDKKDAPKPKGKVVKGPEIQDKSKIDFKPALTREELEFIFEDDTSDQDQFTDIIEQTLVELQALGEDLSIAGRLKRRSTMRRSRNRIAIARKRAMARRATTKRIGQRARRSAIELIKSRFAGGRETHDLSFSERARIERQVQRRKGAVDRLSRRLIRGKRAAETHRLTGR